MVMQVVTVTPPAAGQDWTYTVPGQYLPYLYGVTATLTTATPVTSLPDDSGNGRTGTVVGGAHYTIGDVGPFGGGLKNYSVHGRQIVEAPNAVYVQSASLAAFSTANFSMDGWLFVPAGHIAAFGGIASIFVNPGAGNRFGLDMKNTAACPYDLRVDWGGSGRFDVLGFASCAVWHHVAVTYDGANLLFYADGALVNTTAAILPAAGPTQAFYCGGDASFGQLFGNAAGWAYYGTALTGGQVAAHAAAGATYAGYTAAVNADGALVLYGMNTLPAGPSRIATLVVTDGTNTVGQFPASFPTVTASSFIWSWQVLGPGAGSSTDGQINSVPIPELAVSAGYTIGVKTLDLAATDKWGPINIWFDDGTGAGGGGPGGGGPGTFQPVILLPSDWQGFP